MSTNQPIDPDTGQPVEPSTESSPPESFDEPRDADDAAPARADQDLIMEEVFVEDDPGSSEGP